MPTMALVATFLALGSILMHVLKLTTEMAKWISHSVWNHVDLAHEEEMRLAPLQSFTIRNLTQQLTPNGIIIDQLSLNIIRYWFLCATFRPVYLLARIFQPEDVNYFRHFLLRNATHSTQLTLPDYRIKHTYRYKEIWDHLMVWMFL